jgi:hypothetical protein
MLSTVMGGKEEQQGGTGMCLLGLAIHPVLVLRTSGIVVVRLHWLRGLGLLAEEVALL